MRVALIVMPAAENPENESGAAFRLPISPGREPAPKGLKVFRSSEKLSGMSKRFFRQADAAVFSNRGRLQRFAEYRQKGRDRPAAQWFASLLPTLIAKMILGNPGTTPAGPAVFIPFLAMQDIKNRRSKVDFAPAICERLDLILRPLGADRREKVLARFPTAFSHFAFFTYHLALRFPTNFVCSSHACGQERLRR